MNVVSGYSRQLEGRKMADFDPLYYWLGIPPSEQPPDHYRLLGIQRFEHDPRVIENAADRQMVHLKTFQTGPHSDDSQRLLNRVATARICLLNPAAKNTYDEQLRREEAQLAATAPVASGQTDSLAAGYDTDREEALRAIAEIDRSAARGRRKKGRLLAAAALVVVIGATVVAVGTIVANWPALEPLLVAVQSDVPAVNDAGKKEVADALPVEAERQPQTARADKQPLAPEHQSLLADKPPVTPEQQTELADKQPVAPERPQTADSQLQQSQQEYNRKRDEFTFEDVFTPKDVVPQKSQPTTANEPQREASPSATNPSVESPTAEKPPAENQPVAKRQPPSAAEQKIIAAQIVEAYNFAVLKSPLERTMMAERLVGDALKAKPEGGEQFVLLQRAAELAAEGGNPAVVFRAADAIAERYEFDASPMKSRLLKTCLNGAASLEGVAAFWTACESQINDYLLAERYEEALDAVKAVSLAISRVQNKTLRMQLLAWKKALTQALKDFKEYQQAEKQLAQTPDDPAANLIVGRWLCFQHDDYKAGLAHLAKGGNAELAALARRETASPPKSADEKASLADSWWSLGENAKPEERVFYCLHAADLYREALPELSGLAKQTAQKRLETVAGFVESTQPQNKLAALLEQYNSPSNKKRHLVKWAAFVWCDDDFILCINGKEVLQGNYNKGTIKATFDMAAGDIITVRAVNTGKSKGFCCVMRSEQGQMMVSGPAWRRYLPLAENNWAEPGGILETAPPLLGDNRGMIGRLQKETGVKAEVIWGTEDTCYLMTQVP